MALPDRHAGVPGQGRSTERAECLRRLVTEFRYNGFASAFRFVSRERIEVRCLALNDSRAGIIVWDPGDGAAR